MLIAMKYSATFTITGWKVGVIFWLLVILIACSVVWWLYHLLRFKLTLDRYLGMNIALGQSRFVKIIFLSGYVTCTRYIRTFFITASLICHVFALHPSRHIALHHGTLLTIPHCNVLIKFPSHIYEILKYYCA